ncbi:potassium transporter KefB [Ectothiorhodospiraceae bacterium BW-2]|nr:potassium transporter KefB [Ectothiorhodospiraceae bacterium BW-2]
MPHSTILNDILILLSCAVVAVALFRRLQLPPILGYLVVGIATGTHALGWVPHGEAIELLAEIGVVFLLFMIGLEISIPHLIAMRTAVLGLGTAQVFITMSVVALIAIAFGVPTAAAWIIGGIIALSSTAIVAKQLVEQLEMQSRHGRTVLGILLFQDLAVVPFLVTIPILAQSGEQSMLQPMLWALLKAAIAFAILFAAGHWLLRPLFHAVTAARSIELFTLTILLVTLTAAAFTFELGLSLALGAFLAGMMLGETEYRHQIEAEVRPFRDVLMGLFFITVGTRLDISLVIEAWGTILLLTVGLIALKSSIIIAIVRLSGQELGVAVRSGVILAQGGEFGFALLTLGLSQGLFADQITQPILAALIFSMIIAPLMIRFNGAIAYRLCHDYRHHTLTEARNLEQASEELQQHVIICGFGRIGQNLASFLRSEGFTYVALDLDPNLIREAWEAGEQVFYGDSRSRDILHAAGIDRASALVVTFHDYHLAHHITATARQSAPHLMIVARTYDDHHFDELIAAGANDVVPESLEASLMLATHTLHHLGVEREEIDTLIESTRDEQYQRLRTVFHGNEIEDEIGGEEPRLHSLVFHSDSRLLGTALADLHASHYGVELIALRRHGIHGENPSPSLTLEADDTLVIRGQPAAINAFENSTL